MDKNLKKAGIPANNSIDLKPENIASQIFYLRGEKVMFDFNLATLYEVETRALKQQVRRNKDRFPEDFMFELTKKEWKQVITNCDNLAAFKFTPSTPFAFTEQGVAMLSSVLRSKKAIEVNIAVMRTFVQLRKLMDTNRDLAKKVDDLEKKYDEKFHLVFNAIKQLIHQENKPLPSVGFKIGKH